MCSVELLDKGMNSHLGENEWDTLLRTVCNIKLMNCLFLEFFI